MRQRVLYVCLHNFRCTIRWYDTKKDSALLRHSIQTILTFTIPVTSLTLDANAYKSGEVCCR